MAYHITAEPYRPERHPRLYLTALCAEPEHRRGELATPRFIAVPVKDDNPLTLRELATVLAALRYWQRHRPSNPELRDIATDGGTLTPLDTHDIDALYDHLNGA